MHDADFWRGKSVFLTGHTGFKGAWMSIWLNSLGARVTGFALEPPTSPSLFEEAGVGGLVDDRRGSITDLPALRAAMADSRPDVVIHMAAQPLVTEGYADPVGTYAANVMGTVHLLEAVRQVDSVRVVLVVTTDKCYENREWVWGYREGDPLGGYDPYSNSKACAELVCAAYRNSFFHPQAYQRHGLALATARAGNVVGGGDWARNRLVPDLIRAFSAGTRPAIRAPHAVRPWQHVLEPVSGYLLLAERLWHDGTTVGEGWNFGPHPGDARPVQWIAETVARLWGDGAGWSRDSVTDHPHEAGWLSLDISKAVRLLGYQPRWDLERALAETVAWYKAWQAGDDLLAETRRQIARFASDATVA